MKLEFSQQISEKYSNIMKIRPVEAELLHTDGQTERGIDGRTDSSFSQFCEGA